MGRYNRIDHFVFSGFWYCVLVFDQAHTFTSTPLYPSILWMIWYISSYNASSTLIQMQLQRGRHDFGILVWSFWDVAVKLGKSASANLAETTVILSPLKLDSTVPHHICTWGFNMWCFWQIWMNLQLSCRNITDSYMIKINISKTDRF